jgi:hypothetical protein
MENTHLSEMEQLRQDELQAALGKTEEQKAEEAQALLDAQNAEAEAKRLAEENKGSENNSEDKPEDKIEEPKSFLDTLTDTAPEVKVEIPETIKAELEAIKAENEALKKEREALESSDVAKLLKSGLTLEEVAKGITKVDYSNYSVNDLIKLELEKQGLKDTDLESALEQELAYVENLSPLAKSKYENDLKSNYKSEIKYEESLKLLDEKLKENATKFQAPDPKVQEEAVKKMTQADLTEIDTVFSTLKSQNYDVKDEVVQAVKEYYNPLVADALYTTKDGKFDVNKFIKDAYTLKFAEADKKAAVEAAEKRGFEKAKKEFANPDMANRGSGGVSTGLTVEQQLEAEEQKRLNRN